MHTRKSANKVHRYTVKQGDTLSALAEQFYGDESLYNHIFEANSKVLSDPDELEPGQVLTIPKLPKGSSPKVPRVVARLSINERVQVLETLVEDLQVAFNEHEGKMKDHFEAIEKHLLMKSKRFNNRTELHDYAE